MFSSRAILAIGCELSMTILIASSRNSGENFLRCSGIGLLRSGLRSYWVPVRNLRGSPGFGGAVVAEAGGAGVVGGLGGFAVAVVFVVGAAAVGVGVGEPPAEQIVGAGDGGGAGVGDGGLPGDRVVVGADRG